MSKYGISNIETSGFDSESSYSEYSNNYDYQVESIDIDDPEVTHVEIDTPQTKAIETPDGIDQETTYYTKEEWEGNGNNFIISFINDFVSNSKQFFVSALATIGNASVALTSGIGKVAEGLYDALHIAGGVVATPVTGIFDFIGSLTGGDTKATERMWNSTRNVVQKEIVNESLDSYYSQYGKNMNESVASGFKKGEIGFSVIETGGEVLGTLATGQALSGSSVLSNGGTNAAVYISGIKGFGQGTEEAWNNGASTFGGITYGSGVAAYEAFQWWSGAKINNIQIGNGISGASKYGSIATRVLLDGVDGAIDTPVRSFFDTAYNGKSYGENFNDRGGLQAILQGFFTGSAFSAISEFVQLEMSKKTSKIQNIDDSSINLKQISKMKSDELLLFLKDNLDNNNLKKYLKYVDLDTLGIILPQMDDKTLNKVISSLDKKKFDQLYKGSNQELKEIISLHDFRSSNISFYNNVIEIAISTIDDELGNGYGIEKLRTLVETGDYSQITENNYVRQKLQGIPIEDIKKYLDEYNLTNVLNNKKINFNFDPVKKGTNPFSVAKEISPNSQLFNTYEEFVKSNSSIRKDWSKKLRRTTYKCPLTGVEYTYEDLIEGYVSEDFTKPGNYKILNGINRAMESDPAKMIQKLTMYDEFGNIMTNGKGGVYIDVGGKTLIYYPTTDLVTDSIGKSILETGGDCTFTQLIQKVESETDALNRAFDMCKMDKSIIIGRGIGAEFLSKKYGFSIDDTADEIYKKLTKAGNTLVDKGFMSSTPVFEGGFVKERDITLIITTKEGSSVADLYQYNDVEQEVLLPSNCKFEIMGVKKNELGNHIYIYLNQL